MQSGPCESKLLMLKKIIVIVIAAALALIDDSVQGMQPLNSFIHSSQLIFYQRWKDMQRDAGLTFVLFCSSLL
jgi:hypothetical protein